MIGYAHFAGERPTEAENDVAWKCLCGLMNPHEIGRCHRCGTKRPRPEGKP